jgi:hypothetical protein
MAKRGRPLSSDTTDAAVLRRRQQTAARVQRYREQHRVNAAAAIQPTPEQLEQATVVIERPFDIEEATTTLAELGLRDEGGGLARDPADAQLQRNAVPVDEHNALYGDPEPIGTPPSRSSISPTRERSERSGSRLSTPESVGSILRKYRARASTSASASISAPAPTSYPPSLAGPATPDARSRREQVEEDGDQAEDDGDQVEDDGDAGEEEGKL